MFWDRKSQKPKPVQEGFPHNIIRPLFKGDEPEFWKHYNVDNLIDSTEQFNEDHAYQLAEKRIVTKFEDILRMIMQQ